MVRFIKYKFSIEQSFVKGLEIEMNQYDWFKEFVDVAENGEITLFDISNGQTRDAIEQVMGLMSEDAKNTLQLDIIVSDDAEVLRYRYDIENKLFYQTTPLISFGINNSEKQENKMQKLIEIQHKNFDYNDANKKNYILSAKKPFERLQKNWTLKKARMKFVAA